MPRFAGRAYLAAIFFVFFLLSSSISMAESNAEKMQEKNWVPEVSESRQDINISKSVIEDIKSKEPFINIQQKKIWDFDDEEEIDDLSDTDYLWLTDLFGLIAMVVEAALWVIPVLLVLYIYRYREYCMNLLQGKGFKRQQSDIPETLFGLDIRQQSLPDNIEQVAKELWQQKKFRDAVSLLYRGSLSSLFKQYKFELSPGATEQDCIRQIEIIDKVKSDIVSSNPDSIKNNSSEAVNGLQRIEHFKRLSRVWIEIAYAHRLPSESIFMSVCNGWNQQFADDGGSK